MRGVTVASIALLVLTSCQPAPNPTPTPGPTPTSAPPTPTPTPVPPPTGITGTVEYVGASTGGLLIFAQDHVPGPNEPPSPTAMTTFTDIAGEFDWDLPAGTYYIIAFLTIDRVPEGPPQPHEPVIRCAPIVVDNNVRVHVIVVLTDEDVGGQDKECVKEG